MSLKKLSLRPFVLFVVASLVLSVMATAMPASAQANSNSPITVWIDQPRQPMIDA
ncbi:MAG: hypothetical protein ACYDEO_12395 [Aggregatilineales bacterium]